ncbi:Maf family protein [Bacillus shivajii]|uniref:Maf family protein n=1 Tax=Bacillus shivajii TaxID=1983719 RepID=UPI001CF98192|nr:Maf family protein [Bacillus shivajii]UCZ52090.1 Maf family protein [Bacillus shivajii]
MKPFILASQSPRRKQLLEQVQLPFKVVKSEIEEKVDPALSPDELVASLAWQKATDVFSRDENQVVLGADTIVSIGGKVLGKPKNELEAKEMLKHLSGQKHQVYTGVAIRSQEHNFTFFEKADVQFYELDESEIESYIASGEPFDKAGSYGIQGLGATLVEKIEGDYFTIVGLPVARLVRALKEKQMINTRNP